MIPELFLVFDCESIGLHGQTFAAGWTLIERSGRERESGYATCHPDMASGFRENREWVAANVPMPVGGYNCDQPRDVRHAFWQVWKRARAMGAVLAADCPWPVEARFLIACVDDNPADREWDGPYPLLSIDSIWFAAGFDPLKNEERKPNGPPAHDPRADARQSARLLIEVLDRIADHVR